MAPTILRKGRQKITDFYKKVKLSLGEEMATHSSILTWEIPWTEEPGRATVHGAAKESDVT